MIVFFHGGFLTGDKYRSLSLSTIVGLGGFLLVVHHHDDNDNLFLSCMYERGEGSLELSGVVVGHPHGEAREQQQEPGMPWMIYIIHIQSGNENQGWIRSRVIVDRQQFVLKSILRQ